MPRSKNDEDAIGVDEPAPLRLSPLGASRDELEAIFQSVGDGITVQGPGGELVYANDAAARLCGLSSGQELLSLSATELLGRFEIIGQDGEAAPARGAAEPARIREPGARERRRRIPRCRNRRGALVGAPRDTDLH